MPIDWTIIEGHWHQFAGQARQYWGRLTDNEWEEIAGEKDRLIGVLQQHYGLTYAEAEYSIERFVTDHGVLPQW
ncbi:MAG: CsbD family protein [Chloroflexaceae bacterium]|nr:CsbD family protein [Chloroflexaceae bacterium]